MSILLLAVFTDDYKISVKPLQRLMPLYKAKYPKRITLSMLPREAQISVTEMPKLAVFTEIT